MAKFIGKPPFLEISRIQRILSILIILDSREKVKLSLAMHAVFPVALVFTTSFPITPNFYVVLSKNNELSYTFDNEKLPNESILAKAHDFNRRIIASVVALAIVLSCIVVGFNFITKAEGEVEVSSSLKPVEMSVRLNGQDGFTTATVPAGVIAENESDITFSGTIPSQAILQKALLVDHETNTETEIARVAKYQGKTYYSLDASDSAGTLLLATQDLVLVYAEKYNVVFNQTGNGTYTPSATKENGEYYVWGGEDLTIQCNPDMDYYTGKVEYTIAGQGTKLVSPSNNYVKISSKNISGDVAVTIPFIHIEEYTVNDVRYMSNSKYYPELKGLNNHGGITGVTNRQQTPSAVAPGNTATFYLFSQANSTNSQRFLLNNLAINGIDVKYPKEVGQFETTPYKNGGSIKVTLLRENNKFDGETSWPNEKPRTLYKVEVFNVHEDIEVSYYFKNQYDREIIIKGLTGIEQTAYAEEDNNIALATRYYTFTQDTIYKNVYPAYYTARGFFTDINWFPSDNLVLYTVKPGYNPYTVKTEMYYDDEPATGVIRDTEIADTPLEVIKQAGSSYEDAGRYNTSQRYWGYSEDTVLWNHETSNYLKREGVSINRTDLLLTTLSKRSEDWYAVALSQNESYNQQLYLDAEPYEYHIECDLNGGNISEASTGYTLEGNKLVSPIFKMENGDVYTSMPSVVPTQSGKRFLGWQMVDEAGNNIAGGFYTKNAQFVINKDTVGKAVGNKKENENQTFKFVAVWQDDATADTATVHITVYQEVLDNEDEPGATYVTENGKRYKQIISSDEEQHAAQTTILLDRHEPSPENAYVLNDALSELEIVTDATNPENNQLAAYYDFNLVTLTVTKQVYGRPNTKAFNISVKLTPDENSVFTLEEACELIDVDELTVNGSDLVYTKLFENGGNETFEKVPYGWTFEVSEETKPSDFTSVIRNGNKTSEDNQPLTGTLTEDTNIVVENSKLNDDKNVETDKWLSKNDDGTYKLTMEAYATGQTVVDEVQNAVPTDYVLILDQSGSMAISDMPTGYEGEYKDWTCESASGKYFKANDGQYYPVVVKNKPNSEYHLLQENWPTPVIGNSSPEIWDLTTMHSEINVGGIGADPKDELTYYAGNNSQDKQEVYYRDSDGAYYRVHTYSEPLSLRYHATLYYVDENGIKHNLGTYVYNWLGINPSVSMPLYTNSSVRRSGNWPSYHYTTTIDKSPGYDLFYTDSLGAEHRLSETYATTTTSPVYSGTLYTEKAPQPRRDALENAAKSFVDIIEYQAEEYDVDHRLAVVGFSSNNYSADYNIAENYNNTEILTGNTIDKTGQNGNNYSVSDTNGYWYFPRYGENYEQVDYKSSGTATNYNGPQYFNYSGYNASGRSKGYATQAGASEYANALVPVYDESTNSVNSNITTALKSITAYGGTEPEYGFYMANNILESRTPKDIQERNTVVVFFTDGAPGNYGHSDQIEKANTTVAAASQLKASGAKVFSIGIFDTGDDMPLTYTDTTDPSGSATNPKTPPGNYFKHEGGYFYFRGNDTSSPTYNDRISDYMKAVSSAYPSASGFYTKGTLDPMVGASIRGAENTDGIQYYTKVTDASGLTAAFEYISEQAGPAVTTATLGPGAKLRDIITEDFDLTEGYTVQAYTEDAVYDNDDLTGWQNKVPATGVTIEPLENNVLNVTGFDYATHYVSPQNTSGTPQKLIVEIDGVKPNKTGGVFDSNTGDSGIYLVKDNDSEKFIDAFPIPSISRYKYNVKVEDENKAAKVGVDFEMTANDWTEPAQIAKDNDGTVVSFTPENNTDTQTWKENSSSNGAKDGDYIIFEEILESENNSGVKRNDNIPDNYTLSTTVFNPDDSGDYEYELFIDGEEADFDDLTGLPQRDAEILIRSKLVTQQVMIRKLTRTAGSEDDYADWNRPFTIKVQLKDKTGADTGEATYDDVVFNEDGIAEIPLKHNQMKLFNIPNNYTIVVSEEGADPYVTSYLLNNEENERDTDTLTVERVTDGTSIIVYNTIEAPVITGVYENESASKLVLSIATGISGMAAIAYVYWKRRKIAE